MKEHTVLRWVRSQQHLQPSGGQHRASNPATALPTPGRCRWRNAALTRVHLLSIGDATSITPSGVISEHLIPRAMIHPKVFQCS